MKAPKKRPRNFRVDVLNTSLQIMCEERYEAERAARTHSRALKTSATVIQLRPDYAVLDTYRDGELVEDEWTKK